MDKKHAKESKDPEDQPLNPKIEEELLLNEDLRDVNVRIRETIKVTLSPGHRGHQVRKRRRKIKKPTHR